MKEKFGAVAIIVAAILASSCCWGPLLLAGLGTAGVGSAVALAPYRPYFISLTAILLIGAWYLVLRRSRAASHFDAPTRECSKVAACCEAGAHRRSIVVLSAITVAALLTLSFPQIEAAVVSGAHHRKPPPAAAAGVQTLSLQVRGWSCEACAAEVEMKLSRVPGVVGVHADYATGTVKVQVKPEHSPRLLLRDSIAKLGYNVTSIRRQ